MPTEGSPPQYPALPGDKEVFIPPQLQHNPQQHYQGMAPYGDARPATPSCLPIGMLVPSHSPGGAAVLMPTEASTSVRTSWSWCSTAWSALAMWSYCGCICGFVGLLCSLLSYVDHKTGDYNRARYKRRCAWGWSMAGIAVFVLGLIGLLVFLFVYLVNVMPVWARVTDTRTDLLSETLDTIGDSMDAMEAMDKSILSY